MSANNANLKQLRAFTEVADKKSFVAASHSLNMSQPALSQCIRQLELHVGSPLFNRTTRHVRLTPLGAGFLPLVRDLLKRFDTLMNDVQSLVDRKHGNVAVACLPSVAARLMPKIISASDQLYPGIHISIYDSNLKGVFRMIMSGEVDFGIASGVAPDNRLGSAGFAWDKMYAVLPVSSPLARKRVLRWQDLSSEAFISMSHETGVRDLVDRILNDLNLKLNTVNEISNFATLIGLVEEGVGITAAPGLSLPRDNQSLIRRRPLIDPVARRNISLVWKRGQGFSPASAALISALKNCITSGEMQRSFPEVDWDDGALDINEFD